MTAPMISVLMPAYNAGPYLTAAIDSICTQSFSDFEFIIVNDGSTDNTEEIILACSDARIKYLKNDFNMGIVGSLNVGLQIAVGKYIARMDSDDISQPDRFAKQIAFLESHPKIGVCGGSVQAFGAIDERWAPPLVHDDIVAGLLFESCLMHPTVFIRRQVLEESGIQYREEFKFAEDYDLWLRLASVTRFANLPDVLLKYRVVSPKSTLSPYKTQQALLSDRLRENYIRRLGVSPTPYELSFHNRVARYQFFSFEEELPDLKSWFLRLYSEVQDEPLDKKSMQSVLLEKFYGVCFQCSRGRSPWVFLAFCFGLGKVKPLLAGRLFIKSLFNV